jgi:uncharacterized protein YbaR (Trm112 family)
MHIDTLDILRCPYCGGRLTLVTSMCHRSDADQLCDGVLACHCCLFPVVAGIPVLHLHPTSTAAREHIEAGRPELARRAMFNLDDTERAARFEAAAASDSATYREIVETLGPDIEGGYFLYRFSDPTYLVAHTVVRAVAGTLLRGRGRAIDLCGGSGHLTRSLLDLSAGAPVLADLYFAKLWLAKRFIAPGCEPVCCDGNAPLPFARAAFRFAMCSDALHYIWTKRQFVVEMLRLIGDGDAGGGVLVSHAHNERQWSPSQGQPLPPEGYRDLFETLAPRLFGEAGLFADIVKGGPLDLARLDTAATLDADPALTIIATRAPDVFVAHRLEPPEAPRGQFRISPLYVASAEGDRVRLRLQLPSDDYEQEYSAARQYLPEEVVLDRRDLAALEAGRLSGELVDLVRRRVIVDLPKRYY